MDRAKAIEYVMMLDARIRLVGSTTLRSIDRRDLKNVLEVLTDDPGKPGRIVWMDNKDES